LFSFYLLSGWGAFTKENIKKYLKINEENGKSTPSAANGKFIKISN
jgi:hypothetical protein